MKERIQKILDDNTMICPIHSDNGEVVLSQEQIDTRVHEIECLIAVMESCLRF